MGLLTKFMAITETERRTCKPVLARFEGLVREAELAGAAPGDGSQNERVRSLLKEISEAPWRTREGGLHAQSLLWRLLQLYRRLEGTDPSTGAAPPGGPQIEPD